MPSGIVALQTGSSLLISVKVLVLGSSRLQVEVVGGKGGVVGREC